MNKHGTRIFSFLLILTFAFALSSCGLGGTGIDPMSLATTPALTTPAATTPGEADETVGGFDYYGADIGEFCTVPSSAYAGLSFSVDVTDGEVDDYINDYILSRYPYEKKVTDRAIAEGDTVYIYYTGYMDGEAFAGGSNATKEKPDPLTIGSGAFIPGFEDGLIGVIPSETSEDNLCSVEVTFPDTYPQNAALAGKAATFRVQVVYIAEQETLTELTSAYVLETLGFETEEADVVAAFRADLFGKMRDFAVENLESTLRDKAYSLILKEATFTGYPDGELARIREQYVSQFEYYFGNREILAYYYGYPYFNSLDEVAVYMLDLSEGADWSSVLDERCADAVKELLLLHAVAENEGITVTNEQFSELLTQIASENGITEEDVLSQAGRAYVYNQAITDAVFELVLGNADIDYGELEIPEE